MATSERRVTPRLRLHIPISVHRMEAPSEVDEKTKAIDISTRGVYFLSNREMRVGEALEVRLAMPRRLTGASSAASLALWKGVECPRASRESVFNCFVIVRARFNYARIDSIREDSAMRRFYSAGGPSSSCRRLRPSLHHSATRASTRSSDERRSQSTFTGLPGERPFRALPGFV
jgi:hypothetical protein